MVLGVGKGKQVGHETQKVLHSPCHFNWSRAIGPECKNIQH